MSQYKTDVMEYYASLGTFPDSVVNLTVIMILQRMLKVLKFSGGGLIYLKFRSIATYPRDQSLFMKPSVTESEVWMWDMRIN